MSARTVLYLLLLIVAAAAAVLSFSALRDLALVCGFAPWLAWLLPVVVDAGAAAGSLVWLGGWSARSARRFARALALALLGLSVGANALGHGLAAFSLAPQWWVVVIVSAVAPAVLGAVVHLAVLVGRPDDPVHGPVGGFAELGGHDAGDEHADAVAAGLLDERGLSRLWETAPPAAKRITERMTTGQRAEALIAEGAGRRRLAQELDISEYQARRLLDEHRTPPGPADDPEQVTAPLWGPAETEISTGQIGTGQISTEIGTGHDVDPQRVHEINTDMSGAGINGTRVETGGRS
ncbi:MAG: DUF2637 domain-containing protein [Pseudonocardia sp.]